MKTNHGFTLIELLVVVTIIVVLLALLVPAMDKAIEQAERAVCGANLKVISSSASIYALDNKKTLFIPRARSVTIAFDPKNIEVSSGQNPDELVDWPAALASVGLASSSKAPVQGRSVANNAPAAPYTDNEPGKMWNCPGRDWESYWAFFPGFGNAINYNMFVGYQYFGGVKQWNSPFRGPIGPAPSPRKLGDPGSRALATDFTAKINFSWGSTPGLYDEGGTDWYAKGTPPHTDGPDFYPAGQQQTYLDGSVEWVPTDKLLMIHSWNGRLEELFFFWQQDLGGWSPAEDDASWARNQR